MANPKRTLNAKAVLIDIRVGLTDAQIMMKYHLSARGLESLKTKLVAAGLLRDADLNSRLSSPPPTGCLSITNGEGNLEETVDLDPGTVQFGTVPTSVERNAEGRRKLSAKEILAEVKSGLSNAQLMAKYGISGEALEKVLTKIVGSGLIEKTEFDLRMSDLKGDKDQLPTYWKCPSCNMPQPLKCEVCPQCGIIVEKFVKDKAHGTVVEEQIEDPTKVVEQPEHPEGGNQIPVSQIVDDIRSGSNFQQLMEKYAFSAESLQKLLTKMLFAGLLKPSGIAALKPPAESGQRDTPRAPVAPAQRSPLTIPRRIKVLAAVLPIIVVLIAGGVFGVRHYMNVKDKQERLARACASGDVDEARLLLAGGTGANITDPHGALALVIACSRGHLEVADLLLENGADPNFKIEDGYWTRLKALFGKSQGNPEPRNIPLLVAISEGNEQIVKLLLDKGAEVEALDENGCPAVWKALSLEKPGIAAMLLAKGANASFRDKDGNTLLMIATRHGYREIIGILLTKKVDTNLVNAKGDTALMMAAAAGDMSIVSVLWENGATSNAENADGFTALDFSSRSGQTQVANALKKAGAKSGYVLRKELMLAAAHSGDNEILKKVIARQTDVNSRLENEDSALILAIRKGHRDTVDLLLKHGADVTVPEREHRRTPLILAYQEGDTGIVRLLLQKGADPRVATKDVGSPLNMAARDGRKEMMDLFLREGVGIDAKSLTEAFRLASLKGHAEVCDLLLERGADVNATDENGSSPLMVSVRAGRTDIAKFLVNKGANINSADEFRDTPLIVASLKGYKDIVKLLLEKRVDVNAKNNNGVSALYQSISAGEMDLARLLLDSGADVNVEPLRGEPLLAVAYASGDIGLVGLLLDKGADVNSIGQQGKPLLTIASDRGDTDSMKFLLERKADVDSIDKEGTTSLMKASSKGDIEVAGLLLEKGANVNARTNSGKTPLMFAASGGHTALVKLFLEKGANVNAKTNSGKTPLMFAASGGHTALVELFLEKGADIDAIDKDGKSAMSWASDSHHDQLASFLVKSMVQKRMRQKGADNGRKKETGGERSTGSR